MMNRKLLFTIPLTFFTLLYLLTGNGIKAVQAQDAHLYFLAIAGEEIDGNRSVFLRWYAFGAPLPIDEFYLYRKLGDADSANPMELVSVTEHLRNEPLIRTIFEQPRMTRAKDHLFETLDNIVDEPVTNDSYVSQLITILDGEDDCDQCEFRSRMLANANYGVAIVQGEGYLDAVPSDIYTYELRTVKESGEEVVLGRVTINANQATKLPAPTEPEQVDVPGEKGHLRIHLKWDFTTDLFEDRTAFFGYNVYRGEGDLSGEDFETLLADGDVQKINRLPVLPPSGEAIGPNPEDQYIFVDDNRQMTENGPVGELFEPGDVHTYWVAPIDLLGQNGEMSDPGIAMAEDKSAPRVPRSLNTTIAEVSGQPRIVLTWDRNSDDTVNYKVYRFREWDHVGRKDAFPPVDGLTEGYIDDVAQPGINDPFFLDTTINVAAHENKAFWYCVSAVDMWGNESALSPPFRGVIFDKTPPSAPESAEVCTNFAICSFEMLGIEQAPDLKSEQARHFIVEFNFRGSENTSGRRVLIQRIKTFLATTNYIPPEITTLYNDTIPTNFPWVFRDELPIISQNARLGYRIVVYNEDGTVCSEIGVPGKEYDTMFTNNAYEAVSMRVLLELSAETIVRCRPAETGVVDHYPFDDTGSPEPVGFNVPQAEDAEGVILYRSPDCETFFRVSESRFEGEPETTVEDYYVPEQGGRICYAIRYFDENNNLSPLFYIPSHVAFPTLNSGITPSLISADSLGDETLPVMLLRWFGANTGLAGFRIELASDSEFSGDLKTIQITGNDYSFDAEDNEFEASIEHEDDATMNPLQIDQKYFVRVVAIMQNGTELISNNHLTFTWSSIEEPHEHPAWPIRPLPPDGPALRASWLPYSTGLAYNDPNYTSGNVILVGILTFDDAKEENLQLAIEPPFIVYRKRIDIPNKPYIQISPLIDLISTVERDLPNDPFFISTYGNFNDDLFPDLGNTRGVFYLDTVDLILGAVYEYKIVRLDPQTGEIAQVYGPSTPAEVKNP